VEFRIFCAEPVEFIGAMTLLQHMLHTRVPEMFQKITARDLHGAEDLPDYLIVAHTGVDEFGILLRDGFPIEWCMLQSRVISPECCAGRLSSRRNYFLL
jgi:hypothetical protein